MRRPEVRDTREVDGVTVTSTEVRVDGLPPRLSARPPAPSAAALGDPWLDAHAGLAWTGDHAHLTALFDAPTRALLCRLLERPGARLTGTLLTVRLPRGATQDTVAATVHTARAFVRALHERQRIPTAEALADLATHDPLPAVRAAATVALVPLVGRTAALDALPLTDPSPAVQTVRAWATGQPTGDATLAHDDCPPSAWLVLLRQPTPAALLRVARTHPDPRVSAAAAAVALPQEGRLTLAEPPLLGALSDPAPHGALSPADEP